MASTPDEVAGRRQWGFLAVGVIVVLASGLGFLGLWRSAGERVPVLVAARDIGRFETLEAADLRVALVGAEPGVATVPESELDEIVGRVTVTELPAGSILSPGQLVQEGERVVAEDEAVVGARLGPGSAPVGDLPSGTRVLIVIRPSAGDSGAEVGEVEGWLAEISDRNPNNGSREASLVVPQSSAGAVAAAAAEERIAVVGLEG